MANVKPDQLCLDIAHRSLATALSIEQVEADPTLRALLHARARHYMARQHRFDSKRLQANDHDE